MYYTDYSTLLILLSVLDILLVATTVQRQLQVYLFDSGTVL